MVLYHLWPTLLPAGFVGVDVFFVISGYLITSHMIGEVERTGRLGLARFYARRARRILPAATLVVVSTTVAALALLPELRWAEVTRQGTASLLWVQNWLLASDSVDYLAEGTAPSPFQHFWSLSIEEQFYVVWPVLLVALLWWRSRTRTARAASGSADARRAALTLVLVLTVVSFACSVVITRSGDPAAYFVSHTRFWELGVGALLALSALRTPGAAARAVSAWVGLLLIAGGMVLVPLDGFPGALALVPTVGAVLVIFSARAGSTPAVRRLSSVRPVLWLGDVSYSVYLWHWPLLVLAPYAVARLVGSSTTSEASTVVLGVVLVLSLVLAGVSRRVVEVPFHRGLAPQASARRVLAVAAAVLLVSVATVQVPGALGAARAEERSALAETLLASAPTELGAGSLSSAGIVSFAPGDPVIVPAPEDARDELPEGAEGRCKASESPEPAPRCEFGPADAEHVVALVGDSHAEQYLPALQEVAEQQGVRVVTYLRSSCPYTTAQPVSDVERDGVCERSNEATTQALLDDASIDVVVTSNRTDVDFVVGDGAVGPVEGFVEAWTGLVDEGLPVVVLADNPQMLQEDATTECVVANADDPTVCARPAAEALPLDLQVEAAAEADVTLVDTLGWFCADDTCPAVIGSVLVYRDYHHITPAYSRTLAPLVWESISEVVDPASAG
ncbi:hypothetical protein ASG53_09015 [Sanguibacter sp. Leaf3]|nr:hypothetical protein ASG53_09015 [Sanguibacter sp. Leaf3]